MYLGGAKRRGGYYDQQHEAWNKTRHFLILMHFERHPKGSFVHKTLLVMLPVNSRL